MSRIFLTACVLIGIASLTPQGGDVYYGILRPVSAVFFVVAFASGVLESAQTDHEVHSGAEPAGSPEPQTRKAAVGHGVVATAH